MKFISWNVNGFRANVKKGFYEVFDSFGADIFAIQETKLQAEQIELELPGQYHDYWSHAVKKGYSGTAVFTKTEPLSVQHHLGLKPSDASVKGLQGVTEIDQEGRICALEFEDFYFVNCYTPNAQDGLARIDLRMTWGAGFTRFASELDKDKPVVICGDLNVAHNEIDLKNFKSNKGNAGFSDEERADFNQLLDAGFTDTFRHLYPDLAGAYSWWSFRGNARANNTGWRIDYFLVSDRLADSIVSASIYPEVIGSDHCPVGLELAL
ncbi:MAG: exodeoxyribonuclease III [Coriobacteriia bacterium]|nr:exodeoxyribonuclease III [Coriobacteriia bacterium]MCL2750129.1 exodeoxyribonuclease III [Coriobacteriia bacterium]